MTVYFEDNEGHVMKVEPDCPCSLDGKLLLASDVPMDECVEVHVHDGWYEGRRVDPNQKMNFILQVEVPHWAKPRDVYNHINKAILNMRQTHADAFASHTLSSNQPL
jgi:hypothetical protein